MAIGCLHINGIEQVETIFNLKEWRANTYDRIINPTSIQSVRSQLLKLRFNDTVEKFLKQHNLFSPKRYVVKWNVVETSKNAFDVDCFIYMPTTELVLLKMSFL